MIDRLKAHCKEVRYRRAYLRAIDAACERHEIWGTASRTDGLRAIRSLERLNGRPFDPHSECLVSIIRGRGARERSLRIASGPTGSRHPAARSQGE